MLAEREGDDPAWFWGCNEAWVPRNMAVRAHATACAEIHAQLRGGTNWRFRDKGQDFELGAGQAAFIPAGLWHHIVDFTEEQSHHFSMGYFPEKLDPPIPGIDPADWARKPVVFPLTTTLEEAIYLLIRELTVESPGRMAAAEAAVRIITIEIHRAVGGSSIPNRYYGPLPGAIAQAQRLMDEHPEADWSVANLARSVRLSERHFSGLFRKHLRETPHAYHQRKRLERARRLLRDTNLSITDIALECGFSSSQNFATAFRRHSGLSPRAFRRPHG